MINTKKDNDSVDVLILNKNYDQFLEQSLLSVINQTYKSINIIVVDDNSKDKSLEILEKYKDKIKIIKLKEDSNSISKVRNMLLDNITSKYCAFLSSDDFFHSEFIEKQIDLLENTKDDIGGVYSNFYWVDSKGEKISIVNNGSYVNKHELNYACSKPSCIITFESTLFKSAIFNGLRFDLDIKHGEETYMGFVLSKRFHFIHNDKILAYKTKHPNQGHVEYLQNIRINVEILNNKIKEFNLKSYEE